MPGELPPVFRQEGARRAQEPEQQPVRWYQRVVSWWRHTISPHFSVVSRAFLLQEQAIPEQDPKKRLVILTTLRDMTTRESSPEKKEKIRTLFLKALGGIGDRSQPVELGEFAEEYGRLLGRRQPLASSLEELTRKIVDLFVRYPERTALTILEGFVETLPESEVSESGKAVMTQWINILSSTKTPKEKLGALLELNEALNQLGDADGRLVYRTLRNAFSEGTNTLLLDLVDRLDTARTFLDSQQDSQAILRSFFSLKAQLNAIAPSFYREWLKSLPSDSKVVQEAVITEEIFALIESDKDYEEKLVALEPLQRRLSELDPTLVATCRAEIEPTVKKKVFSLLLAGKTNNELFFLLACLSPQRADYFLSRLSNPFVSLPFPEEIRTLLQEMIRKIDRVPLEEQPAYLQQVRTAVKTCEDVFNSRIPQEIEGELKKR